eukprot:scaffold143_cov173-Ochromonas_danica.AAC.6
MMKKKSSLFHIEWNVGVSVLAPSSTTTTTTTTSISFLHLRSEEDTSPLETVSGSSSSSSRSSNSIMGRGLASKVEENQEDVNDPFYILPPHLRPGLLPEPPNDEKQLSYDNLYNIIARWNPDDPEIPTNFREKIQHFDYGNPYERQLAEKWRDAELPFKLYNVSDFQAVSKKWTDSYLIKAVQSCPRRPHVERSTNNHFLFWSGRPSRIRNYRPPTELVSGMTYKEWVKLAHEADAKKLDNTTEHYYYMVGADAHEHGRTFVSRDLPMFSTEENNFWITNVAANKGIQCRFSMRGIISATHYDTGKNFVAMLKGAKRYILTPPRTCDRLGIIPDTHHPSYRHSTIDWSDLGQAKDNHFDLVDAIDTIVHKGELLYIPSFWFHFIVSLKYSIQCNSRSGTPPGRKGWEHIMACFKKK